jgi:serine/threonine protein kinase
MNQHLHEEELFDAAMEISVPEQRLAFLDQACAGNAGLRARIESLLAAQKRADKFFGDSPAFGVRGDNGLAGAAKTGSHGDPLSTAESALTEGPGTRIGRYKLLQRIGEGGCGVVYMAEQEEPVRRRIALKVIKLGMDTKSVIARFEAERQALAMMDHPNIARVLDAGATDTGRPFFVMELVHGIKITEYCDRHHLDTRQRLDLFVQICHAIQHAHQKGIIHRDVKPSNVLVTVNDGVPVPKVIDFGIAKATEGRLTDKTYFTPYQQFIGTPAYMSPEQAERSDLDIDTRSDIYSLGVLLYELLTGKTPFDADQLLRSGLSEMRRTLRETEPQRPSTMLTTIQGKELTLTAQNRHAESPPKLISLLRGDLDWIVMKALEKDRKRRYETANGLAMDIQRHLNNEPVIARPPSRLYQFQKLVRRNRIAFWAAAAVAAALILGLGACTFLLFREKEARQRAVAAEEQQKHLREEAERSEKRETELRQQADAMRQQAEVREMITKGTLAVRENRLEDADTLADLIPLIKPNLEGAAVLRALGEWHALHGRWKTASERFTALLQVNQLDGWDVCTSDFLQGGSATAELGDSEGFEQFRRLAITRFANTTDPFVAERILRICLLEPANPNVIRALTPLAEVLLPTPPAIGNASALINNPQRVNGGKGGEAASIAGRTGPSSSNPSPPAVLGVYSFDGLSIGLEFSAELDEASATNATNYSVTGATVTNVSLEGDGKSVVLWLTSQITGGFTVSVNNVKDIAGNAIPSGSTVGNSVVDLHLHDFETRQKFSASYAGNVASITAGGENIWEQTDQFIFAWTLISGDFDYCLRIHSISPALDDYTRVGLMARDSLRDPACREVMVGLNATDTFQVLARTMAGGGTASLPPNPLPAAYGSNSWVRLQRTGAALHAFCSSNGTDWVQLYQIDSATGPEGAFADPIYFGIATCAHSTDKTATAVVSDLGVTPIVPVRVMADLALMEYRRGNGTKAAEWCRRCLAYPEYNAPRITFVRIVLAMSCHHLGQTREATSELDQARKAIEARFKDGLDLTASSQYFWYDWIFARVLLREAEALFNEAHAAVNSSPSVK